MLPKNFRVAWGWGGHRLTLLLVWGGEGEQPERGISHHCPGLLLPDHQNGEKRSVASTDIFGMTPLTYLCPQKLLLPACPFTPRCSSQTGKISPDLCLIPTKAEILPGI